MSSSSTTRIYAALALLAALGVVVSVTACAARPEAAETNPRDSSTAAEESDPPASDTPVGQDLIGQSRDGGVVVYVLQPTDEGYDPNIPHGVIAATEDVNTIYTNQWDGLEYTAEYVWTTSVYQGSDPDFAWRPIDGTSAAIGSGSKNTDLILLQYPADIYPNSAAAVARSFRGGGYSDWFLPSIDELDAMCVNKRFLGTLRDGYWSSTDAYASEQNSSAFGMDFTDDNPPGRFYRQYQGTKNGTDPVRPARYF